MKISEILFNEDNPRLIRDVNFNKLMRSILSFPKMLELRQIVIDGKGIVLGGNMRLKVLVVIAENA